MMPYPFDWVHLGEPISPTSQVKMRIRVLGHPQERKEHETQRGCNRQEGREKPV